MKRSAARGNGLAGPAKLPGEKAISHRAALFAALPDGKSIIQNFLVSGVTEAMLQALKELGVDWELNGNTLTVIGQGLFGLRNPVGPINCGNSATTMRLLAGALAASGVKAKLDGSSGLRRRPMLRITEPLGTMGVTILASEGGYAPLLLSERNKEDHLKSGTINLDIASAQVKTCLLLAALAADGPVTITEPVLSRDHTERMLRSMGVEVDSFQSSTGPAVRLIPPDPLLLTPLDIFVPGDFSAAAFLIVAGLITPGSSIALHGIGLNPTRIGLLTTLREMGADIVVLNEEIVLGEPVGDLSITSKELHGVTVTGERVVQMIDEFPVFAVAASFAHGLTTVNQSEELRNKESDRISAMCNILRGMRVHVEEAVDGFTIHGNGKVPGGVELDPHGDHRLAMSLAIAGLAAQKPISIINSEIVAESFPDFVEVLKNLGANIIQVENE
jgi:3-phosphoshikimate 1-carboxyvinyltransferase